MIGMPRTTVWTEPDQHGIMYCTVSQDEYAVSLAITLDQIDNAKIDLRADLEGRCNALLDATIQRTTHDRP